MKIAPIDIAHKGFGKKLMGYDPEEVSDFLRAIADEMEQLVRERNQLKDSLREKDLAIVEFKERDQILKDTITTAHKMAESVRGDAEREARLIINDANQKSEMIAKDARDSLKKLYTEINDLKRIRISFDSRMRSMLQTYMAIMDDERKSIPDLNPLAETPVHGLNVK